MNLVDVAFIPAKEDTICKFSLPLPIGLTLSVAMNFMLLCNSLSLVSDV